MRAPIPAPWLRILIASLRGARRSPGPTGPALLLLMGLAGAAGCGDAASDPLDGLVAEEAAGALALAPPLPSPDRPEAARGGEPAVLEAVAAWRLSWERDAAAGAAMREDAYPVLSAGLAGALTLEEVEEDVARLEVAARRARELQDDDFPDHVRRGVSTASASAARARAALEAGRREAALLHTYRGADALRAVGPEAMARSMVAEAAEAQRRNEADSTYTRKDRERAARLISGAREALQEGDWVRALRRAYYARALLNAGG